MDGLTVIGILLFFLVFLPIVLIAAAVGGDRGVECPKCGRKGTIHWEHAKKDGTRDRRYGENYLSCSCGWKDWDDKDFAARNGIS